MLVPRGILCQNMLFQTYHIACQSQIDGICCGFDQVQKHWGIGVFVPLLAPFYTNMFDFLSYTECLRNLGKEGCPGSPDI